MNPAQLHALKIKLLSMPSGSKRDALAKLLQNKTKNQKLEKTKNMKAILRTYHSEIDITEKVVEISENHHFEDGPYVDTIPFSVGSNQAVVPLDESLRKTVAHSN